MKQLNVPSHPTQFGISLVVLITVLITGCGGGGGGSSNASWCPGTICNNCATDPNCNVSCPSGKMQACVGGSFFDADPNLRCGFCQ